MWMAACCGLEAGLMNLQMAGSRGFLLGGEERVQQLVHAAFEPHKAAQGVENQALAMTMREIDARVFAQQGACTIHSDASDLSDIEYKHPPNTYRMRTPKPDERSRCPPETSGIWGNSFVR
jgi:hypothetical protein